MESETARRLKGGMGNAASAFKVGGLPPGGRGTNAPASAAPPLSFGGSIFTGTARVSPAQLWFTKAQQQDPASDR